jgi:hypothetical protein
MGRKRQCGGEKRARLLGTHPSRLRHQRHLAFAQRSPQWRGAAHVLANRLQPADLVFFATTLNDPSTIHRVGIYIGDGQMNDASQTGADVRIESCIWPDYIGAVRPQS